VLAWYALRASRPSWPNAFVDRISGANDALEEALEPLVDEIAYFSDRGHPFQRDRGHRFNVITDAEDARKCLLSS
jgi:hypothetical protein